MLEALIGWLAAGVFGPAPTLNDAVRMVHCASALNSVTRSENYYRPRLYCDRMSDQQCSHSSRITNTRLTPTTATKGQLSYDQCNANYSEPNTTQAIA
jgi:hypothetical protein